MKDIKSVILKLNEAFTPLHSDLPIKEDDNVDPLWPVTSPSDTKLPHGKTEFKVAVSNLLDKFVKVHGDSDVDDIFKSIKNVTDEKIKKDNEQMTNTGKKTATTSTIGAQSSTSPGVKKMAESALRGMIRKMLLAEGPRGYSSSGLDDTYAIGSYDPELDKADEEKYDEKGDHNKWTRSETESGKLKALADELGVSVSGAKNFVNKTLAVYAVKAINNVIDGEQMDVEDWNKFTKGLIMPPEDAYEIGKILNACVAMVISSFVDDEYTYNELVDFCSSPEGRDVLKSEIEEDPELTQDDVMFCLEILERDDMIFDLTENYGMDELGKEVDSFFTKLFIKEFDEKPRDYLLRLGVELNKRSSNDVGNEEKVTSKENFVDKKKKKL